MTMPPPAATPATLESFFEAVWATNPFLVNRVDRPLDPRLVDVGTIHEAAFKKIVALGEQARRENRAIGVTAWGEAGVGKSHLLARLGRWSQDGPQAAYVYLHNLQASPERLPRYVLRAVLNALTSSRGGQTGTPLFRLLNTALKDAVAREGKARPSWSQVNAAYRGLLADLAGDPSRRVLFDRTVYQVLFRYYGTSHPHSQTHDESVAELAIRWLAGEPLDNDETRRLGLREAAPADNQHAKQVLVALTQVAWAAGQLVLLGFDQVDNLDEAQVKALSRFLHDLLDSAGNLLIVTTGVRHTMLGFLERGVITETSWDRLGQFEVLLGRLGREQGQALLRARLQPFLAPVRGVPAVEEALRGDPLFPLGSPWFEARVGQLVDFRPRDLIGWAGERWQRLQEGLPTAAGEELPRDWAQDRLPLPGVTETAPPSPAAIEAALDRAVAAKIAEHRALVLREPAALPADEDALAGLLEAALRQCAGAGQRYLLEEYHRQAVPRTGQRGPYDFTVDQRQPVGATPLRIRVRVLVPEHANSAVAALRRLVEDEAPPPRVLLVTLRDRLPLGQKGSDLLEQMARRGQERFRHVEMSPEQYADLDALQTVVQQARGDDFEFEPAPRQRRAATEQDVIASHHRAGRYLAQPLLRELLGGVATPPAPVEAPTPSALAVVDEPPLRQFLMAEVALRRQTTLEELARCYTERQAARGAAADQAAYSAELRAVALRLAQDGLLRATPENGGLGLAPAASRDPRQ